MIFLSDMKIVSPGFTPGGARKAIRDIERHGATVLWYSLTTVLYKRDAPLPGDSPLITFVGKSSICAAYGEVPPNERGIERAELYFFEMTPGAPMPPNTTLLDRGEQCYPLLR